MGNLSKSKKYSTPEERRSSIDSAYAACSINDKVTVKDLAEYIGVSERCVRDRLKEADDAYWVHQGIVGRKTEDGKAE